MQNLVLPTDDELRALTDEGSFQRARRYLAADVIEITARTDSQIHAIVSGKEDYTVRLLLGPALAASHCTCPAFGKGLFCKHLIATAMVARVPSDAIVSGSDTISSVIAAPEATLRDFLKSQPADRLAGWLSDLADADPVIERRLRLYQSQQSPAQLRKALGGLLRAGKFLDWRASRKFARELDLVLTLLAQVSRDDSGLEVHEYALNRLFKIYSQSDDSGGDIGDQIRSLAERYMDRLKDPDARGGKKRAAVILALQRIDQWGFLSTLRIWPSLDESARAAYASAIETDYQAIVSRPRANNRSVDMERLGPTDRMEELAKARGDVDLLISVIASDLSNGHAYERIVQILESSGREREATHWAERGFKAHPSRRGMGLMLAKHYDRAGLTEKSLKLYWREFQENPDAGTWLLLKEAAKQDWPTYRTDALKHVTARERKQNDGRSDATLRAQLLIADLSLDEACQLVEAQAVRPEVLEQLAGHLTKSQPEIAAGLLRRAIDATLPGSQPRDYAHQARQITRLLILAADKTSWTWVEEIRQRYRARRKFLALLDAEFADKRKLLDSRRPLGEEPKPPLM